MKIIKLLESAQKIFKIDDNRFVGSDDGRANETVINLSKNNKSKKLTYVLSIKITEEPNFLTLNAKKVFKIFITNIYQSSNLSTFWFEKLYPDWN